MLDDYIIRRAEIADVPEILELYNICWLDTYVNEEAGVSQELIESIVAEKRDPEALERTLALYRSILVDPNCFLEVAVDSEGVKGVIYGEKIHAVQSLGIYIHSDLRGKGLAGEFIARVEDWLDPERPIGFDVIAYNERAIRFYERHGYTVDAVRPPDHRGIPVISMSKIL